MELKLFPFSPLLPLSLTFTFPLFHSPSRIISLLIPLISSYSSFSHAFTTSCSCLPLSSHLPQPPSSLYFIHFPYYFTHHSSHIFLFLLFSYLYHFLFPYSPLFPLSSTFTFPLFPSLSFLFNSSLFPSPHISPFLLPIPLLVILFLSPLIFLNIHLPSVSFPSLIISLIILPLSFSFSFYSFSSFSPTFVCSLRPLCSPFSIFTCPLLTSLPFHFTLKNSSSLLYLF